MFIITDCTVSPAKSTICNDINTAYDLLIGITNEESVSKVGLNTMGHMKFGDVYIASPYYIIDCIPD